MEYKLSDRQKLILKAIIEEYVDSGEPVGSKILTLKPYLTFSSATLRNDMAYLEDIGLLEKTHTSSGRVPSELGYRYYVEHLVTRDYDVVNQFPLIDEIFNDSRKTREEMIKNAIDLLSSLTNYMALASDNSFERTAIAKLDLVQISEEEAILIIVTTAAKVESKRISIPKMGFKAFKTVIEAFDKALKNTPVRDVKYVLKSENVERIIGQYIEYEGEILETFEKAFRDFANTKTYRSGLDTIFEIPEFRDIDKIRDIMRAVNEEHINSLLDTAQSGLSIKIGRDNTVQMMEDCTIISVPYQIGDTSSGTIAVIGPTRMEYRRVIPLLEYIANNMSKIYK